RERAGRVFHIWRRKAMNSMRLEDAKEIPVVAEADVIVVGGGPGGLGAAVAAARQGADTLLIERYGLLGGMASMGEVHPFMPNHIDGKCLDRPVFMEWARRMKFYMRPETQKKAAESEEVRSHPARSIGKEASALAAEELCLEAGAKILFHHWLTDVVTEGRNIDSLVLVSKSGLARAKAKMYVDATGDGDLAARAGCDFEQGGPSGHSQPMTLCFKLGGIDKERMPERGEINRLYDEAKEKGELECPRENVLLFQTDDPTVLHFNTTRVIRKDATVGLELSQAELESHKQLRQFIAFFRKHVSGFENCFLHSMAHHIGIRESRRILGRDYITLEDYKRAAKYDDAIARCQYMIDIHNPDGAGTEHYHLPEGEYYEIPYGCIVPKDIDNLTVGGRPISVDHPVHSSMRVMPPACSVGQAAGVAAAMAVAENSIPSKLDGKDVRQALKEMGAYL
ncbi:MAG: FAD-dependent oxidoreductase, partial [Candidatus Sumerlaeota bacterium]